MGTTIKYDFVNAVYNVPEGNYYVIFEAIDFDKNKNTIILSEGLIEDSKYASTYEKSFEETNQQGSYIYDRYGAYKYAVTDEDELIASIAAIGNNYGTIRIVGTITLTGVVTIAGTGSYIIEGDGIGSIIDCGGNNGAFSVTGACNITFRNFKIDSNDMTATATNTLRINNANCTALIDAVNITGDGTNGRGIVITAGVAKIRDCIIDNLYYGIYIDADYSTMENNTIHDCANFGALLFSGCSYCICSGNILYSNYAGLSIASDHSVIKGNNCTGNGYVNLHVIAGGDNNVIADNVCSLSVVNAVGSNDGILCSGDNCSITGNVCNGNTNAGAGTGYGIRMAGANSAIVGNTCKNNDTNLSDLGAGNTTASNEI